MKKLLFVVCIFMFAGALSGRQLSSPTALSGATPTCTIAAWDSVTGDLGIATESQMLACGAIIPYAHAGVGLIAAQGISVPINGTDALIQLEQGHTLQQTLDTLTASDPRSAERNFGLLDAHGGSVVMTGVTARSHTAALAGEGFCILADDIPGKDVLDVMAKAYRNGQGNLAEKLLDALDAAERVFGNQIRCRSASLLLVRKNGGYGGEGDRYVDLRVDADSLPLLHLHQNYAAWTAIYLQDADWHLVEQLNADRKFDASRELLKRIVAGLNEELRKRPDDPKTLIHIARELATHDLDRDRALELALRADKISPSDPDILDTMGECYYHLGRFDEAIAVASRLVALEPANEYFQNQLQKFRAVKQQPDK